MMEDTYDCASKDDALVPEAGDMRNEGALVEQMNRIICGDTCRMINVCAHSVLTVTLCCRAARLASLVCAARVPSPASKALMIEVKPTSLHILT